MVINQSNVIFVYNSEDPDGEYFAKRYGKIHNLAEEQLVGIDTDTEEIVDSYQEFKEQLEDPLRQRIISLKNNGRDIFAIVLGWRIPAGFYYKDKVISSTSRISSIAPVEYESPLELNKRNPLFNRGIFKRYDKEDSNLAFIVTQLDAPIRQIMDRKFDEISAASNRVLADGIFYFDKYSGHGDGERATLYQDRLNLFDETTAKRMSIEIQKTVQIDEFNDVFFGQLRGDSFFWGWGVENIPSSYFYGKDSNRIFFYNGDFTSLKSFRSFNTTVPGVMAISGGYLAVAGAMDEITRTDDVVIISPPYSYDPYSYDPYSYDPYSYDPYSYDPYSYDPYSYGSSYRPQDGLYDPYSYDPYSYGELGHEPIGIPSEDDDSIILETGEGSFDIFLDPIPFFDTALRGGVLGESFIFSNPFLNNSITIFGDPLMNMEIPNIDKQIDKIDIFSAFSTIAEKYAKAYSYLTRRAILSFSLVQRVVDACEVEYPALFLDPASRVHSSFSYARVFASTTQLGQRCKSWIMDASFNLLPPIEPMFFEYITHSETKISDLFLAGTGSMEIEKKSIPYYLIFDEGSWFFETTIQEMDPHLFFLIQFELLVGLDPEFNDILFEIKSVEDLSRWQYEEPFGFFKSLTYEGVPSNLFGRKIRYQSDEFKKFTRFTRLYLKYRQVGDAFFYLPYSKYEDVVSH